MDRDPLVLTRLALYGILDDIKCEMFANEQQGGDINEGANLANKRISEMLLRVIEDPDEAFRLYYCEGDEHGDYRDIETHEPIVPTSVA